MVRCHYGVTQSKNLPHGRPVFLEACEELGYEKCSDHNDPTTTGAGPHAMNKINGRRISVAEAYLTPSVRARPNLTIMAETTARRVVFTTVRLLV